MYHSPLPPQASVPGRSGDTLTVVAVAVGFAPVLVVKSVSAMATAKIAAMPNTARVLIFSM